MSTWFQDLKKQDPKLAEAYSVVGANSPIWALRNMVTALSHLTALNTPDDEKRLKAARYILKHHRKQKPCPKRKQPSHR